MHKKQKEILILSETFNFKKLSLRKIGELIKEKHPQKVKHHLGELIKKEFLIEDKNCIKINKNKLIKQLEEEMSDISSLINKLKKL